MVLRLLSFALVSIILSGFTFFNFSANEEPPELPSNSIFYPVEGNTDWLKIRNGLQVTVEELLRVHLSEIGLGAEDELINYRTETDELGITHYRYRQHHRGLEVDGTDILIHEKDGVAQLLNGKWVRGLHLTFTTALDADAAIDRALTYLPAEKYMWEDPEAERMLQRVMRDPNATFYPQPELVWIDPAFTQEVDDYRPAYRMTIHSLRPVELRKQLFVDAVDGQILLELEMLHDSDVPGTAETKYNGPREIVTDSLAAVLFRLFETGRGGGIETYDLNQNTEIGAAVDFVDQDNHWNNINLQEDEVATDAHWGAEMTFDYFLENHGWIGVDGAGMPLINYVHYDTDWMNASWSGAFARFGDGNGVTWSPLTSLDVVGHEFVHGVTDFTSDLVYRNESGALNESFSDIFGTAIELWATPEQGDWLIGEDFDNINNGLRNMSNPKEDGDPDTYLGDNWEASGADNGGVHTNSGVQNFWFYLLVEGGSGANDKGHAYTVEGLGLDTAAAIAFRNLRYYLGRRSQYIDARLGAIQAAEDLYGICSEAVQQTTRAWFAAGVGPATSNFDLRLVDILNPAPVECGFAPGESITLRLRYNGCGEQLAAGDSIPLAFWINESDVQWDTLILSAPLSSGDTLTHTFSIPASELAQSAVHQLRCWIGLEEDPISANDTLYMTVDNIFEQNVDFQLMGISQPRPGCFLADEPVDIEIGFFGCDSIAAGEEVQLLFSVNGGPAVTETVAIPETLYRGDTFSYSFNNPANFPVQYANHIAVWVNYGPDFLVNNDTLFAGPVSNPVVAVGPASVTFEAGPASLDSLYVTNSRESDVLFNEEGNNGTFGIRMTGGDLLLALQRDEFTTPEEENVWEVNEVFSAKTCFCADLSTMDTASLSFDLRQTYSIFHLTVPSTNRKLVSPLRVLANGQQISETYRPATFKDDPWKTHRLSLNDFLGSQVEICFETRNTLGPEFDNLSDGDNAFIDNILIEDILVGLDDPDLLERNLRIYPNPGGGLFTVHLNMGTGGDIQINIFDNYGRSLKAQKQETITSGDNTIRLDLEDLTPGMYFIRLQSAGFDVVRKLIIQ